MALVFEYIRIYFRTTGAACLPLGGEQRDEASRFKAAGPFPHPRGTSPELGDEAMSAARAEPVHVQMQDGGPTRFVWRERLYTVLAILERPGEAEAAAAVSEWAQDTGEHDHEPAGRRDWRCWRVSAAPGKNVPATGFRLCSDAAADRWVLTRDG